MDRGTARATLSSRVLRIAVPTAAAFGAGAAIAAAASHDHAAAGKPTIAITTPAQLQPTTIVLPPDAAKSVLTFDTRGLSKADGALLAHGINIVAFSFGLGTPGAPNSIREANFTKVPDAADQALADLAAKFKGVTQVTLTEHNGKNEQHQTMSNVAVTFFQRGGNGAVSTFGLRYKSIQTGTKGGVVVSEWNKPGANPPSTGYDLTTNTTP